MKAVVASVFLRAASIITACAILALGNVSERIHIQHQIEIPGAKSTPKGFYQISVVFVDEDRTILRFENTSTSLHELWLAVENRHLASTDHSPVIFFPHSNILRAWIDKFTKVPLELAYPMPQAVEIVTRTRIPVLAIDLPAQLSSDDMKLITLLTVSPSRLDLKSAAKNGLSERLKTFAKELENSVSAKIPKPSPKEQIAKTTPPKVLTKTTSNIPLIGLASCFLILGTWVILLLLRKH